MTSTPGQDAGTNPHKDEPRPGQEPHELSFPILVLIGFVALVLTALAYNFRTNYLDSGVLSETLFRALRMGFIYLFFCMGLLLYRYGYKLEDFGIRKENLLESTLFGIAIYSVALAGFLWHVGNTDFDHKFVDGKRDMETWKLLALSLLTFFMAATTDIWSRGFVLLTTEKLKGPKVALLVNGLVWFGVHIYEILLLEDSFGLWVATGLTIFLGLSGDLVALKYRNVIGLGIGHIYLNLVFIVYVVWM